MNTEALIPQEWKKSSHPASLWQSLDNHRTKCLLCPRGCVRPEGESGFCGVRKNIGGSLHTLNYGKSVPMTRESIETEAVFHYAPGESILSLGNIGCMMSCDFCQNWTTSQARLVRDTDITSYTPEDVVDYALRHGIRVLSWTYNDPVVWHEFVLETARLGRAAGLKNLYKSAFYITEKAIDELIEVMDIFSISLKSMSSDFYSKVTRGELYPVLEGIKQVHAAGKNGNGPHLEVSNLCVTGRNDNLDDSRRVARWMLENLDADVPLHYVRFHPDFLYTHVERTSIPFLEKARLDAIDQGVRFVYVGNVHGTPSANTYCPGCNATIVARYGLAAKVAGLLPDGKCAQCGTAVPLVLPWGVATNGENITIPENLQSFVHHFRGPIQSCHIEQDYEEKVYFQFEDAGGKKLGAPAMSACLRFMISSGYEEAVKVRIFHTEGKAPKVFEVYDRAHFPVLTAEETRCADQNVPLQAVDPTKRF